MISCKTYPAPTFRLFSCLWVRLIYPAPEDKIEIVPSTRHIEELARASRAITEAAGYMNDPTGRSQLEEVLGDPDTVLATQRRRFWEFQNRINSSSAPTASYLEAWEALGLDPGDPVLKATSIAPTKNGKSLRDHT